MAETTTAQAPVEQGPPSAESAVESLESAFGGGDTPAPRRTREQPEEVPEQEAAPEETDELSAEDLPDDAPPASVDAAEFEIVHNGTQHKLSRAETIKLAQQGFDYTQKTQSVAAKQKEAEAVLQRAAEIEQMVPLLAQEMATVKAFEGQLQRYAQVDWVRLATEDPLEYPKHRAQYDQLVQSYQAANGQFQQKAQSVQQARQQLTANRLQQERAALVERIPAWSDPAKYQAGAQELSAYLIKQGADPDRVANIDDSFALHIAHKAMLYDRLVSAKAEKSKQLRAAPPVVRPGANAPSDQGRTNFQKATTAIRSAARKNDRGTQERLAEMLLGKAFPK